MIRSAQRLAFAAAAAFLAAGAAQAAPVSYAYRLQPGELDFTIESTALNAQGYGTVDPAAGLLGLTLNLGGQTFQASDDPLYPTFPDLTLVNSALSFASYAPTVGGVSYSFFATAPSTAGGAFDYMFTSSTGTSLSGTGVGGAVVPEPASAGLLAAGMVGVLLRRRRA